MSYTHDNEETKDERGADAHREETDCIDTERLSRKMESRSAEGEEGRASALVGHGRNVGRLLVEAITQKLPVVYLLESKDRKPFYIGFTRNQTERLTQHCHTYGKDIAMTILQDVFVNETPREAERKWIRHYHSLGIQLTNVAIYAASVSEAQKAAVNAAHEEAMASISEEEAREIVRAMGRKGGKASAEVRTKKAAAKRKSNQSTNSSSTCG